MEKNLPSDMRNNLVILFLVAVIIASLAWLHANSSQYTVEHARLPSNAPLSQ
jgi:hypothetical protein